jgi:hypothetical protein
MLHAALASQLMYYHERVKGDDNVEEMHSFSHTLVSKVKEAAKTAYGSCSRNQATGMILAWGADIRERWVQDNLHLSINLDMEKNRISQVCCSNNASICHYLHLKCVGLGNR